MNKLGTIKFSGKSGVRYAFTAYSLDTLFDEAFSGVYVATLRKEAKSRKGFVHKRICMGQSGDLRKSMAGVEPSFSERGANCICVYEENDQDARRKIEQDLVREPIAGCA